jgi:hypothetical protein
MAPGQAPQRGLARRSAFFIILLGGGSVVAAPKLQAVGETALGYTDNVRATPESPGQAAAPHSTGAFLTLSPGLVLALEAPRSTQRIGYRFEYDLFFAQSNASRSSNQVDYRGFFELSRPVTLTVGSSASETNRYAAIAFATPGSGTVTALPAGSGAFLQAAADETLGFDLGVGWRAWQGSSVAAVDPILGTVAPRTLTFAARAGIERSFFRDSLGGEASSEYTVVHGGVRSDGTPSGVQELLVVNGVGLWRHDWGRALTSSAQAGAARVQRVDSGRGFWTPTGAASLAYANVSGDAQLFYTHSVSTNALLGQSLLADEIRLRGALPLTAHDEVLIAVTAGYQHGRLIDENATLAAHVNVAMGDVVLGWQATRALQLTLRYQHIQQMSDATTPPLPLSFTQNSVLLGALLKLPPDRDMPRPYRAARRVDRSDELRDGVSPEIDLQRQSAVPASAR